MTSKFRINVIPIAEFWLSKGIMGWWVWEIWWWEGMGVGLLSWRRMVGSGGRWFGGHVFRFFENWLMGGRGGGIKSVLAWMSSGKPALLFWPWGWWEWWWEWHAWNCVCFWVCFGSTQMAMMMNCWDSLICPPCGRLSEFWLYFAANTDSRILRLVS